MLDSKKPSWAPHSNRAAIANRYGTAHAKWAAVRCKSVGTQPKGKEKRKKPHSAAQWDITDVQQAAVHGVWSSSGLERHMAVRAAQWRQKRGLATPPSPSVSQ